MVCLTPIRFFFLDGEDRKLIAKRRDDHSRLEFALQMCTVRYIGRFLPDGPRDVPWVVIEHLAAQLQARRACTHPVPRGPVAVPRLRLQRDGGGGIWATHRGAGEIAHDWLRCRYGGW
nr:DUF4158 domain-containing protein [Streptomyces sp. MK7]